MTTEYSPSLVSWNVTSGCNLACAHCYLAADKKGKDELTTAEGINLISQMAEVGTEMLILTGGEPLLRRDIYDLAACASKEGITVVMGSNGTLITKEVANRLVSSGVISVGISLDSMSTTDHDRFRGLVGAWDRAVKGIDRCQAAGIGVLLQTTVTRWNCSQLPQLLEFAYKKGLQGVTAYFLVCTGRGEELTDITPEQYEQTLSYLIDIQGRYPGMMVRARCAPHVVRIASQKGSPIIGSAGCMAATSYCRITPEGDVTPCPYLPLVAGNVRKETLGQIWESSSLFEAFRRPQLTGRCGACEFRNMCIGCRARAFATRGDYLGEDPWCTYVPQGDPAPASTEPAWTPDALTRLRRVPVFLRGRVKRAIEERAHSQGDGVVTIELIQKMMAEIGRMPWRRPRKKGGVQGPGDGE
ncbi:MAG: radical SAM protein [Dehalococcoidia bacterium]